MFFCIAKSDFGTDETFAEDVRGCAFSFLFDGVDREGDAISRGGVVKKIGVKLCDFFLCGEMDDHRVGRDCKML